MVGVSSFAKDIAKFRDKARKRSTAIFRESAQRLAHKVNTSIDNGGRTPVDTGFMVASFTGSTSGVPRGPGSGRSRKAGEAGLLYRGPVGQPVELAILSAQLGQSVWMGWSANYSVFMEERYGFFRAGSQNWQNIVNEVTVEAKRRIP